jgi:oxygen-dependent protoporphyrinogen oxidase
MGRQVVDRLVGPLVGGINAGRAEHLSLASTAPQLAEAAAGGRSLVLSLRRRPQPAVAAGPVFLGVVGGLGRLVDRLADVLAPHTQIRMGVSVTGLEPTPQGRWRLTCDRGAVVEADGCVVTSPAPVTARLLRELAPGAAATLDGIRYASVALATMGYAPDALRVPLEGSGYLVPRSEGRLHTACTFTTTKWPALGGSGLVLVRASAGRDGDERPADLDDAELVARLHREVAEVIGVGQDPMLSRVDRWPRSFPQYDIGHRARVDAVDADLAAKAPGVVLAGAAHRGLGIASCVGQARDAAARVVAALAPAHAS